jgi:hypothetical protein
MILPIMSASILSQTNQFLKKEREIPSDAEKFAVFKARKLAKKEAERERLAAEFPLLFGKDAKAKSTVGKYSNKDFNAEKMKKKSGLSSTLPRSGGLEERKGSEKKSYTMKTSQNQLSSTMSSLDNMKKAPSKSKKEGVQVKVINKENSRRKYTYPTNVLASIAKSYLRLQHPSTINISSLKDIYWISLCRNFRRKEYA